MEQRIDPKAAADESARIYARVFLPLWWAMVALQSGFLIHDVSAAWLISRQTSAGTVIALAQTASTLPFFLFALPAGALADMMPRGRIALAVALALAGLSLAVAVCVGFGLASIPLLLSASLLNGCANAIFTPAWQAMTPELVKGERLPGALALNSLGMNIARSLGPVAAGFVLFLSGPPAAFLLNSLIYACVALTFARIAPRGAAASARIPLTVAVRAGLAYARHEPGLLRVAVKGVSFFFFASSFWALAPVVVRNWFGGTSLMLGLMVGAIGIGAVAAAQLLKRLRRFLDIDGLMLAAGLAGAAALALVPLAPNPWVMAGLYMVLGFCWLLCFSSVHLAAQLRLTPWIRARGTAVYLIAVFGSVAVGSLSFGVLSDLVGTGAAYGIAGAGLAVSSLLAARLRITRDTPATLVRSRLLPDGASGGEAHSGPVLVRILYTPRPQLRDAARTALAGLHEARLRTGALACVMETRADGRLAEETLYGSAATLATSAARHTDDDARLEVELLDSLASPPEATIG